MRVLGWPRPRSQTWGLGGFSEEASLPPWVAFPHPGPECLSVSACRPCQSLRDVCAARRLPVLCGLIAVAEPRSSDPPSVSHSESPGSGGEAAQTPPPHTHTHI